MWNNRQLSNYSNYTLGGNYNDNRLIGNNYNYTIFTNEKEKKWDVFLAAQSISEKMRAFRAYKGLTQEQLAFNTNCSQRQITRLEEGRFSEIKSNRYIFAISNYIFNETGIRIDTTEIDTYKAQKNSKTGVRGVCFAESIKKYISTISFKNKHYNLGKFIFIEDALAIRKEAEAKVALGEEALKIWIEAIRKK